MMVNEIKEIQQQLSVLREEMKTLVDELDQVKDLREQDAYAHSQECGAYEVELSTLRAENERLRKELAVSQTVSLGLQDGVERLTAENERLRERCEAAESNRLPNGFCLCQKCRCTWEPLATTKSSRCPACGHIDAYPHDGLGE